MRFFNLVQQLATYTDGTQSFAVGAAIAGRQDFTSLFTESGERIYYHAETADKTQWELSVGVWDGGTTLERANVIASSAAGGNVNFSADVTLSLVSPAGSMLVIDSSDPANQAIAFGDQSMAAGPLAKAWGPQSAAIGVGAEAGSSSTPVSSATSMGSNARAYHDGATALGANSFSFMPYAIHGPRSVLWSGSGFTSGAETNDLSTAGSFPLMPTNSAFAAEAIVVARRTSGEVYACVIRALLKRGGSGNAVIEGSASVTEIAKTAGVTASATIVALTGGEFAIRGTGVAAQDWDWGGSISGVWV